MLAWFAIAVAALFLSKIILRLSMRVFSSCMALIVAVYILLIGAAMVAVASVPIVAVVCVAIVKSSVVRLHVSYEVEFWCRSNMPQTYENPHKRMPIIINENQTRKY